MDVGSAILLGGIGLANACRWYDKALMSHGAFSGELKKKDSRTHTRHVLRLQRFRWMMTRPK